MALEKPMKKYLIGIALVCAAALLIWLAATFQRPVSWVDVAEYPPKQNLTLSEILALTNEGKVGYSAISTGKVMPGPRSSNTFVIGDDSGVNLLAVFVGDAGATKEANGISVDQELKFYVAVTRRVDQGLFGKLSGVTRDQLREREGEPLLQVYMIVD